LVVYFIDRQESSLASAMILKGSNLSDAYTIPGFANCGLETLLINLAVPGSGNTITLTLGNAHPVTG